MEVKKLNPSSTYQLQHQAKVWNTALYIRLSQDDIDKSISNSVKNQIDMLETYVNKSKDDIFNVVDTYIDDGYSGTNFIRPDFIRMMDDIKSSKVDCIITKDLARFGRDHIGTDNYLEIYLPSMNVRFITLMNPQLDSFKNPQKMNSIEVPFLNLINEEYARDISRKTKSSLISKCKNGQYVGSHTPYGYLKDPEDRNKLIVDENTVMHVKCIYQWYISGMSISEITRKLNDNGILSPIAYRAKYGISKKPKNVDNNTFGLWHYSTVKHILNNQLYTGDMVQGKSIVYNHKVKRRTPLPKEKWIIVPNNHEPIVLKEQFDAVQELMGKSCRAKVKVKPSPFAQYLICADCGKNMIRTTSMSNGKRYSKFVCSTSKKYGKKVCSSHIISEDVLLEVVLYAIQTQIACAADIEEIINKSKSKDVMNKTVAFLEKKHRNLQNEIDGINRLKQGLYEDCKSGLITKYEYLDMKSDYEKSYQELNIEIANLSKEIAENFKQATNENKYINMLKQFGNITEITREVVVVLIDKIIVHEGRRIEVVFKFQDEFKKLKSIFAN